jgi:cell division protein FtsA
MTRQSEIYAGVDLGSSKIAAVIMELDGERKDVIGVSMVPSQGGIRAGQVVAIDETIEGIRTAVEEASRMADCHISSIRLAVSGPGTLGFNSDGTVAVRGGRVTPDHVARVLETASAVKLPADRLLLHTLPQEFVIDGHDGIRTPVGMSGVRLEARVHAVTCNRPSLSNAMECCKKAKLDVSSTVFSGLASSAAVLSREERELGVVLVDVGGGTTDMAVWYDNALVHTVSFEWGGDELTRHLARGLRTPSESAEKIKRRHGCAMASMVGDGETMEVPGVGGREPQIRQRHLLCELLEPLLEDFFARVAQEIDVAGCREQLAAGVVLTGGTSNLEGIADLGMDVLIRMPVRIGRPGQAMGAESELGGLHDVVADPAYATATGLCLSTFESASVRSAPKRRDIPGWLRKLRPTIEAWF